MTVSKPKRYVFLKDVSPTQVDLKYKFQFVDEKDGPSSASASATSVVSSTASTDTSVQMPPTTPSVASVVKPTNTTDHRRTHLGDLSKADTTKLSFRFLDEAKKDRRCVISMYNMVGEEVPTRTTLSCFWCRHGFDTMPIGCPLYYRPHRVVKKMSSEMSWKDSCIIRENVSNGVFQRIQGNLDHLPVYEQDFYIVDGVFCSFPCCLSFIRDNKHKNPIYRDSEHLIRQMCHHAFPTETPIRMLEAPDWRLLQNYGGHLSIHAFRNATDNTQYVKTHQIVHKPPVQKMVGHVYEVKLTL